MRIDEIRNHPVSSKMKYSSIFINMELDPKFTIDQVREFFISRFYLEDNPSQIEEIEHIQETDLEKYKIGLQSNGSPKYKCSDIHNSDGDFNQFIECTYPFQYRSDLDPQNILQFHNPNFDQINNHLCLNWKRSHFSFVIALRYSPSDRPKFYFSCEISQGLWGNRSKWLEALIKINELQCQNKELKVEWDKQLPFIDEIKKDLSQIAYFEQTLLPTNKIKNHLWTVLQEMHDIFCDETNCFRYEPKLLSGRYDHFEMSPFPKIPVEFPAPFWEKMVWNEMLKINSPPFFHDKVVKYWIAHPSDEVFIQTIDDRELLKSEWPRLLEIIINRPPTETMVMALLDRCADYNWPCAGDAYLHLCHNIAPHALHALDAEFKRIEREIFIWDDVFDIEYSELKFQYDQIYENLISTFMMGVFITDSDPPVDREEYLLTQNFSHYWSIIHVNENVDRRNDLSPLIIKNDHHIIGVTIDNKWTSIKYEQKSFLAIEQLTRLEELQLISLKMPEIPVHIQRLGGLKKLVLDDNNLTTIPDSIQYLTQLEYLSFKENSLQNFPSWFTKMESLRELYLDHCDLHEINDWSGLPPKLEVLSLKDTRMTHLIGNPSWDSHLRVIILAQNPLKVVPDFIYCCEQLTEINLSECGIYSLSDQIRNLIQLEKLDVSKNNLNGIPRDIAKLDNLRFLNIYSNFITELPYELGLHSSLKEVYALQNPLRTFWGFPKIVEPFEFDNHVLDYFPFLEKELFMHSDFKDIWEYYYGLPDVPTICQKIIKRQHITWAEKVKFIVNFDHRIRFELENHLPPTHEIWGLLKDKFQLETDSGPDLLPIL